MSGDHNTIRDHIQRIAKAARPDSALLVGEIVSATETDCTVKVGEMELTKVRLFSQESEAGNLLLKPKQGAMALVVDLSQGALRVLQVIWCYKVELIRWEENGLTVELDSASKKVDIKNEDVGLKDLMQSVADIVKQLTVSTPAGPSGTPLPPTVNAVTQFETDFKKLLK